jgi:pimeloyl-ACP methyl ester carboxylesterase
VPTAAVLDHFSIDSCTLMGISLGGFLAMRAAAFESRIRRVAALDVMFDRFDCFGKSSESDQGAAIRRLVSAGARDKVESLMAQAMSGNESLSWAIRHGLWASGSRTVFDYVASVLSYSAESFSSRVTQDVLLMAGSTDHLVPRHQFFRQGEALGNARSLQMRMFTEHESAGAHCQVGNIGLMLRHLEQWLSAV